MKTIIFLLLLVLSTICTIAQEIDYTQDRDTTITVVVPKGFSYEFRYTLPSDVAVAMYKVWGVGWRSELEKRFEHICSIPYNSLRSELKNKIEELDDNVSAADRKSVREQVLRHIQKRVSKKDVEFIEKTP